MQNDTAPSALPDACCELRRLAVCLLLNLTQVPLLQTPELTFGRMQPTDQLDANVACVSEACVPDSFTAVVLLL